MTERLFLGLLTPSKILAVLTAVLVVVTAYYAQQTRNTVEEPQAGPRRIRAAAPGSKHQDARHRDLLAEGHQRRPGAGS
jgi:hypothetical protein